MSRVLVPVLAHHRAQDYLALASPEVVNMWSAVCDAVHADPPEMGLAAGDRPSADVEGLASAVASCEFLLAERMHAAAASGCLPFGDRGGMLAARGWATSTARRLARCGALTERHPSIAAVWAAGVITSEHVDPLARAAERFTVEELAAVVAELGPHWGRWSPAAVARFVAAAGRMLHPPPDPSPDEQDAYQARSLSFALAGDCVVLSGELPRLEGELVMAAIDALAERLRSTADHVPTGARRADALVQLVNEAHAADLLPSRGGLPVAVTVTLDRSALGDPVWTTSRGHLLTAAESRFAACDPAVTPALVATNRCGEVTPVASVLRPSGSAVSPAQRLAALGATFLATSMPLDMGRTQRTATPAQRRALAVRDGGCVIPGCQIPAEACQIHHLNEWSAGGSTDLENMVSLCWAHHRQVDLRTWSIQPARQGAPPAAVPDPGSPCGAPWPANHAAPFVITRTPRHVWRN